MTDQSNRPALLTRESLALDYKHIAEAVEAWSRKCADTEQAPPVLEDDDDLEKITGIVKELRAEITRIAGVGDDLGKPYFAAHRLAHGFFRVEFLDKLEAMKTIIEARGTVYLNAKRKAEQKRLAEQEAAERAKADAAKEAAKNAAAEGDTQTLRTVLGDALEAQKNADAAATRANAKPADLARTRTAAGTGSLQEVITHQITSWDDLPWLVLGPFIRRSEVESAIATLAKHRKEEILAGTFKLAGVTFISSTKGRFT